MYTIHICNHMHTYRIILKQIDYIWNFPIDRLPFSGRFYLYGMICRDGDDIMTFLGIPSITISPALVYLQLLILGERITKQM